MNIKELNELLAFKYSLYTEDVDEALNDEKIKIIANEINESCLREEMTEKDEKLREMIYSYLSRREGNGIYVSVYKGLDEHRCINEGIRHPKNIVKDILFRVKQAKIEPDEYFEESFSLKEAYKEFKYTIPESVAQKCRFMYDVDYGGSEGIYYQLMMLDRSTNTSLLHNLITGKTLAVDEKSFMKMSRLGAYINLLLKSDFSRINTSNL